MRILRPLFRSLGRTFSNVDSRVRWALFPALVAFVFLVTGQAWAQDAGGGGGGVGDFTEYATDVTNNTTILVEIFNYFSFMAAIVLVALAIGEMRRIVDGTGGGGLAWRQPLAKLGFGGALFALPYMTRMAQATMGGGPGSDMGSWGFLQLMGFTFGGYSIDENGLSGFIRNGINNIAVLVDVACVVAFIIGVWFFMRGIQLLKNHIENPGNSPLPDALKRLAVGGALFSLPILVKIARTTFGAGFGSSGSGNSGWNISSSAGSGLDGMMIHFMRDLVTPATYAIEAFCFTAGVIMILFAMQRLVRTAQDGPRGPLGAGTIAMFVIAGILLSFPQFASVIGNSLTDDGMSLTRIEANFLSEAGADAAQKQNAINVMSAVIAFMAVIGFLSIVRGLFMLKTLAEGGQATLMQVTVHLVAGAMCVNLGAVINAVQSSLGLSPSDFAVVFS